MHAAAGAQATGFGLASVTVTEVAFGQALSDLVGNCKAPNGGSHFAVHEPPPPAVRPAAARTHDRSAPGAAAPPPSAPEPERSPGGL